MPSDLASRLRHQVYLQSVSRTEDEGGGGVEAWADSSGPVWAAIEPLEGSEALRGMQLEARVTHRIVIRYRAGVTPALRIRWGTRYFDVRQVLDPDERRERIEMLAEEVTT